MRLRYYVLMIIFLCQHWVLAAQPMVVHSPHHAAADCQPSSLLNVDRHSNSTDSNSTDNHTSDKTAAIFIEIFNTVIDAAAIKGAAFHDPAVKDGSDTETSVTLASTDDHNHVNHMHGHADLPLDSRLWSWPRQSHASQRQLPQFVGIQHTPPVPPPNAIPV